MIRDNVDIKYTDEDKANLTVRQHTGNEIRENKKLFGKKMFRIRMTEMLMFIVFIAMGNLVENDFVYIMSFSSAAFTVFTFICIEIMYIPGRKLAFSHYYVELLVARKLDIEMGIHQTTYFDSEYFYPIEGTDTTTGYKCVYYVTKDEYNRAGCGKALKININGDKL